MKHLLGWGLGSFISATRLFSSRTTLDNNHQQCSTIPTTNRRSMATTTSLAPVAHRDESRFVYAGKTAPKDQGEGEGEEEEEHQQLQSETSTEPLLDPAVAVPDPYGWMRVDDRTLLEDDTDHPVRQHLEAENAFTQTGLQHTAPLRDLLYQEMVDSLQETDTTAPRPYRQYWYYTRTFQGQAYPRYCRAPRLRERADDNDDDAINGATHWNGSADSPVLPDEQILLDVNALAQGHEYCAVEDVQDSPSQTLLAYTVDYSGDELYDLVIMDIATGQIIQQQDATVLHMDGTVEWGSDDTTLYYVKMDDAMRPFQVYRKRISVTTPRNNKKDGATATNDTNGEDELIYQEDDETFEVGICKSDDERYLLITTCSMETSEVHYIDLIKDNNNGASPTVKVHCIAPRRPKVLYDVAHQNGQWWIWSNVGGLPNMALFHRPVVNTETSDNWELARDTQDNVLFNGSAGDTALDSVTMFAGHAVLTGRAGGLPRIWIASLDGDKDDPKATIVKSLTQLEFDEDAYDVCLGANYEYHTDRFAIAYDSLVTPTQVLEISLTNPTSSTDRRILKQRHVPGYDKLLYASERLDVLSRDGQTKIPVSLVYRKDTTESHQATGKPVPLLLYGTLWWKHLCHTEADAYGAYGSCEEATFSATTLALLNRGMVYGIAHVRGGGEMGRQWYEEPNGGKYLCKQNSFHDFVDVARWLVEDRKLTSADLLACTGASAGGLLAAAVINEAPDLFKAAIIEVPFVDVMATMVDASIPLTANEWEEWGNPNEKKYFHYMLEYSPVQNVKKNAKYPACLITGGLHDPRVAFWEPAKLAAALRHNQDPDASGPVFLKIDMTSGHFSASDRYKYLKEIAFHYAFLLDQLLVGGAAKAME
eukprot:scaffold6826_cov170-Amphora_coffeaeformis.AAC.2